MLLYHFTALEHLPSILRDGLNRGEVPLAPNHCLNAVNLTTAATPYGHGLSAEGRVLTAEERAFFEQMDGMKLSPNASFPDQTRVRIKVKILSSDRALVRWSTFARKRLAPAWRAALEIGNRPDTWWLYFGTVPPVSFLAIDVRQGDSYVTGAARYQG